MNSHQCHIEIKYPPLSLLGKFPLFCSLPFLNTSSLWLGKCLLYGTQWWGMGQSVCLNYQQVICKSNLEFVKVNKPWSPFPLKFCTPTPTYSATWPKSSLTLACWSSMSFLSTTSPDPFSGHPVSPKETVGLSLAPTQVIGLSTNAYTFIPSLMNS